MTPKKISHLTLGRRYIAKTSACRKNSTIRVSGPTPKRQTMREFFRVSGPTLWWTTPDHDVSPDHHQRRATSFHGQTTDNWSHMDTRRRATLHKHCTWIRPSRIRQLTMDEHVAVCNIKHWITAWGGGSSIIVWLLLDVLVWKLYDYKSIYELHIAVVWDMSAAGCLSRSFATRSTLCLKSKYPVHGHVTQPVRRGVR